MILAGFWQLLISSYVFLFIRLRSISHSDLTVNPFGGVTGYYALFQILVTGYLFWDATGHPAVRQGSESLLLVTFSLPH